MAWVTDNAVLTAVASIHRFGSAASAPSHWPPICATANLQAYNRIRRVLFARGYDAAGLAEWSERADFNERGAVCNALRRLGLPEGQEGQSLAQFCEVWKELETAQLFDDDGAEILPVTTRARVTTGDAVTTARPHAGGAFYFGDTDADPDDPLDGRL